MAVTESFADVVAKAYATTGPAIELGRGVHDGAVAHDVLVQVPLAMMNRHGLIAGATGTGKTKTLQGLAEQLSAAGVPVVVADIKGDLSGLAVPGRPTARPRSGPPTGRAVHPGSVPGRVPGAGRARPGVPVRATVTDSAPSCWRRYWAPMTPRSRACTWCSATPTSASWPCSIWPICGPC